jgi:predicted ABC-type ATPase
MGYMGCATIALMDVRYVIAIAGPNGAGKTTIAETFLHELLGVRQYVNADTIARGLSQFEPEKVAIEAGRENLRRLEELASHGETFAFETTLAGKAYAGRIRRWKEQGYLFVLGFFWMPRVELALERVAKRVQSGGHHIPEAVVRQRYARGIDNFFNLYQPLADEWAVYDNSGNEPRLVASGTGNETEHIAEISSWQALTKQK